ncbi:MAG: Glu/Leu/Phe/Val dehydrogenase dimerization domain-containing protein [Pseudomonadota bacterium]
MQIFDQLTAQGHEQVVLFSHDDLKAVIAVHNTVLGPALGGVRMWPYANDDDALNDVLRLSRGMTYKAAVAGLNLGGAKAAIIGDPENDKTEALLRSLGRFIHSLGGRFIATTDIGTNADDMETMAEETDRVVGLHSSRGGSGDPSLFTAVGTLHGIRASLNHKFGHTNIGEVSYAVQGTGKTGEHIIRTLSEAGAKVFVSDINHQRVAHVVDTFGAEAVGLNDIYDVDANVFVPCALGSVINEETVERLKCDVVAGSANYQLESSDWGIELEKRGILYAPDFVINAGDLINVATELNGYNADRAHARIARIFDTVTRIFDIAERESISALEAANRMAEERIRTIGRVHAPFSGAPARY